MTRNLFQWLRLWFRCSYALWRTYPGGFRSTRTFATYRGVRAALAGWRQGLHLPGERR